MGSQTFFFNKKMKTNHPLDFFIFFIVRDHFYLHIFLKPLVVFLMILTLNDFKQSKSANSRKLIAIGLLFGMFGDAFLIFREEKLYGKLPFIGGLTSFLIGHLLYIYAFKKEIKEIQFNSISLVLSWLFAIVVFFLFKTYGDLKDLSFPVFFYCFTIMTMFGFSIQFQNKTKQTIAFYGSLLFVLSDFILAFAIFV